MSMRVGERNTVLIAIIGVVTVACARGEPEASRPSRSIVADVVISVANQTPDEKHIFLEARAQQHALGVVPARSSRSFSVPSTAGDSATELRLEARADRNAPGIRSTVFVLASGRRVVWTLEAAGGGVLANR